MKVQRPVDSLMRAVRTKEPMKCNLKGNPKLVYEVEVVQDNKLEELINSYDYRKLTQTILTDTDKARGIILTKIDSLNYNDVIKDEFKSLVISIEKYEHLLARDLKITDKLINSVVSKRLYGNKLSIRNLNIKDMRYVSDYKYKNSEEYVKLMKESGVNYYGDDIPDFLIEQKYVNNIAMVIESYLSFGFCTEEISVYNLKRLKVVEQGNKKYLRDSLWEILLGELVPSKKEMDKPYNLKLIDNYKVRNSNLRTTLFYDNGLRSIRIGEVQFTINEDSTINSIKANKSILITDYKDIIPKYYSSYTSIPKAISKRELRRLKDDIITDRREISELMFKKYGFTLEQSIEFITKGSFSYNPIDLDK